MLSGNITVLVSNSSGMQTGDWITLGAVFVALGIGVASIIHTQCLQKKDRKERLLNKIIDWALEIQRISLEVNIPLDSNTPVEQMRLFSEANTIFKYGVTFTKNSHVRVITKKSFKKELEKEVEDTINLFTGYLYLKNISFGVENAKESFAGTATGIIDELEKQIKGNPIIVSELLKDYGEKLASSVNKLLVKAGETAAEL